MTLDTDRPTCMPLPDYAMKRKAKSRDVLSAAKLAVRYLREPKACEADGIHLDEVVRQLDQAIKAAEAKPVKRQTKITPYDPCGPIF